MSPKIEVTGKSQPRIRVTGKSQKRVDPDDLAKALGANPVAADRVSKGGGPFAFFALRQEIMQRLESTGGRPGLKETKRRQKIPLSDEDWNKLMVIVGLLKKNDVSATPGQVASVLLHQQIARLEIPEIMKSIATDALDLVAE